MKHGEPVAKSVQYQLKFENETLFGVITSRSKLLLTENNRSHPYM